MGPAVPGLGVTAIFYLFAALFAPGYALLRSLFDDDYVPRWPSVGRQFLLALAMIGSVIALYAGIDSLVSRGLIAPGQAHDRFSRLDFVLLTVLVMFLIILVAAIAASVTRLLRAEIDPDVVAAAHRESVRDPETVLIDLTVAEKLRPVSVPSETDIRVDVPTATQSDLMLQYRPRHRCAQLRSSPA